MEYRQVSISLAIYFFSSMVLGLIAGAGVALDVEQLNHSMMSVALELPGVIAGAWLGLKLSDHLVKNTASLMFAAILLMAVLFGAMSMLLDEPIFATGTVGEVIFFWCSQPALIALASLLAFRLRRRVAHSNHSLQARRP